MRRINVGKPFQLRETDNAPVTGKPYSYIFNYQSVNDVEFMAALMRNGVKVRIAEKSFSINGQTFDAGTLVVTRRNNEGVEDFDNKVQNLAHHMGRKIFTSTTGFVERGKDIGSSDVKFVKAPSIAVLFGEQTSSLSAARYGIFLNNRSITQSHKLEQTM
jgi:hypothetical protein